MLAPLSSLYGMAVDLKNQTYGRSFLTPHRLAQPVISVGNLSVGGAGKTPLVIHLARLLGQAGLAVDVLSRGYRRSSSATIRVDPTLQDAAAQFGDEPVLIAESAGCPVYVSASRYQAGLLAERDAPRLHLLDDGFQHRKLFRDVDIVVLHRSDFEGKLLPSGRLREPISSLRRASIALIREEDACLESELRRQGITARVWRMRRELVLSEPLGRTVAFCGIARPDEFFAALPKPAVLATRAFRDHHRYSSADVAGLLALARSHHADTFVTTEKDLVRLTPEQRTMLRSSTALVVAQLELHISNEGGDDAAALAELIALLPQTDDSTGLL